MMGSQMRAKSRRVLEKSMSRIDIVNSLVNVVSCKEMLYQVQPACCLISGRLRQGITLLAQMTCNITESLD